MIRIRSWEDDDAYCISVEDNGAGGVALPPQGAPGYSSSSGSKHGGTVSPSKRRHNGIAIDNTRTRLALMCDGTLDLIMTDAGAIATVRIPKGAIS